MSTLNLLETIRSIEGFDYDHFLKSSTMVLRALKLVIIVRVFVVAVLKANSSLDFPSVLPNSLIKLASCTILWPPF